jgi:uncharacterized protein
MKISNRFLSVFVIFLMIGNTLVYGQNTGVDDVPYIEVNGTAEKEIIPDEIFIDITIRERYNNKTKVSIEEQEEKLKKAVKSLGIDLSNLFLADANADYVKISWQKKDVLTKKEYTLKVTNATTVGQVFQELEKLEITDAYISRVHHSQMEQLKKEVKIMAIKSAKEKADYLLFAIGEEVGKPLIIRENEYVPYMNVNTVNRYRNEGELYESSVSKFESHPIEFQKIKIQTSIYVKFSIK